MIPDTTVGLAREAIFAAINATALISGDPTIHVIYDEPSSGTVMTDDIVSVGDVEQSETPYAVVGTGGVGWMTETYSVEVTISVFRAGDEADVVFSRAVALVNAVRSAVRSDPSLGGIVSTAYPASWHYTSSWDDKGLGRFTVATGHVSCTVQL